MKAEDRTTLLIGEIGETLRICGDPDWRVWAEAKSDSFARGVGLGVRQPLPRCPAIYERKGDWRTYEDSLTNADPQSKGNYLSVQPAVEANRSQFKAEEEEGMMIEISEAEAKQRYVDNELNIAALAALRKTEDSYRVIHDGTHGVRINPRIIMRSQMRCPGVPEQRQVMRYFKDKGTSVFALKGDVSKAHRRVAILEEDWGMQACRLDEHRVWLNTVGTFGIGSAA